MSQPKRASAEFEKIARDQLEQRKGLRGRIEDFAATLIRACRDAAFKTESATLVTRMKSIRPWTQASLIKIVVLYSDVLYIWIARDSFQRSTSKFWVKDVNLPRLLITCASEAPLLVYGKQGKLSQADDSSLDDLWKNLSSRISSVYFDSDQLDLYRNRLASQKGAQLLRAWWYGDFPGP